jgi:hypothetical protein
VNLLLSNKKCVSPCLATSLYWFVWAHLGYYIVYGIYLRKPCDHIVANSNSTPDVAHWMDRELFHLVSNCKSCKLLFRVPLSITLIMENSVGIVLQPHGFWFLFASRSESNVSPSYFFVSCMPTRFSTLFKDDVDMATSHGISTQYQPLELPHPTNNCEPRRLSSG